MEFKKYQHLERFGTVEVNGIEDGMCYIFPKIDGTNSSVWFNNGLQAGSRKRHLSLESDNAGFYEWVLQQDNLKEFFVDYPTLRLYGEWLVPHTLKTYDDKNWRKFYVFDVMEGDNYLQYEEYKILLEKHNIEFIPPICKVKNPTYERITKQLDKNTYLIKDGEGIGEGVVIKNYEYVNKYGRITWAKVVNNDFKMKHQKVFDVSEIKEVELVEQKIVDKYVNSVLVDKEFSKIESENGWSSRFIPRLLNTVYYCLVKEEAYNFTKEFKQPTINFKTLNRFTTIKVKELRPDLF